MKQFFLSLAMLLSFLSAMTLAQKSDDYNKFEVYAGYLNGQNKYSAEKDILNFGAGGKQTVVLCNGEGAAAFGPNFTKLLCDRRSFNGFNTSVTYNVSRYIGIKTDFSAQFRRETNVDKFSATHVDTSKVKDNKYSLFGGVQIKDNSTEKRIKPFAHALAGFVSERITGNDTSTNPGEGASTFTDKPNSFAVKLGGGIDVKLSKKIDLRVIEFDYVPIFAKTRDLTCTCGIGITPTAKRADNFTFGFGIVIH